MTSTLPMAPLLELTADLTALRALRIQPKPEASEDGEGKDANKERETGDASELPGESGGRQSRASLSSVSTASTQPQEVEGGPNDGGEATGIRIPAKAWEPSALGSCVAPIKTSTFPPLKGRPSNHMIAIIGEINAKK